MDVESLGVNSTPSQNFKLIPFQAVLATSGTASSQPRPTKEERADHGKIWSRDLGQTRTSSNSHGPSLRTKHSFHPRLSTICLPPPKVLSTDQSAPCNFHQDGRPAECNCEYGKGGCSRSFGRFVTSHALSILGIPPIKKRNQGRAEITGQARAKHSQAARGALLLG